MNTSAWVALGSGGELQREAHAEQKTSLQK